MMTIKQRRFVEAFDGNATEAARVAGYSPRTAYAQGARLLKNVEVRAAIEAREREPREHRIATREERQGFWTAIMEDPSEETRDRLRASELLGRSQADFLDRVERSGPEDVVLRVKLPEGWGPDPCPDA